jgi:hypothetical protein
LRLRHRRRKRHLQGDASRLPRARVVAFFFNTIVLALTINIGAGLI